MLRFAVFVLLTVLLALVCWAHQMYMAGVNPFPGRSNIFVALVELLPPVRAVLLYGIMIFALFYPCLFPKAASKNRPDLLDDHR